jgi:hypothetical protein
VPLICMASMIHFVYVWQIHDVHEYSSTITDYIISLCVN